MPTFTQFISLIPGVGDVVEKAKLAIVCIVIGLVLGLLGGYKWGRRGH